MNELLSILERHPDWEARLQFHPSLRAIRLRFSAWAESPDQRWHNELMLSLRELNAAQFDLLGHEASRMEYELTNTELKGTMLK